MRPRKRSTNKRRDAVAQPAGQHRAAVHREIADLLQVAVGDQELGIALVNPHAAPDLRHQHADVVIHAEVRAHITGRGGEARIAGENRRHQRVVQIHHRPQRVERTFGERAFAAESRGGGRFAGQAADEIHEQLGQFLIVDRTVNRQRRQAGLGIRRTVPAARPARHSPDDIPDCPAGISRSRRAAISAR